MQASILKWRRPLIVILDLGLIVLANYLAFWLRFDGAIPVEETERFCTMLPWLVAIRGAGVLYCSVSMKALWRYTSIWDLQNIISGVFTSTLVFYGWVHWGMGMSGISSVHLHHRQHSYWSGSSPASGYPPDF